MEEEARVVWFFQGLVQALISLDTTQRTFLQELGMTSDERMHLAENLADLVLRLGLFEPTSQRFQPVGDLLSPQLLAQCLYRLLTIMEPWEDLRNWTVEQGGWYGGRGRPQEEENEGRPGYGTQQRSNDPLSSLRSHRTHGPGHYRHQRTARFIRRDYGSRFGTL